MTLKNNAADLDERTTDLICSITNHDWVTGEYKIKAEIAIPENKGNSESNTGNNDWTSEEYFVSISGSDLNVLDKDGVVLADPVDAALGNYTINVEDMSIEGKNPLSLSRYYNGLNFRDSSLGNHWSHSYDVSMVDQSDKGYTKVYFGDGSTEFFYTDENGQYLFNDTKYSAVYSTGQGNLIFEYKKGETWTFENSRIDAIENEKGIISFTYEGEKLKKVESSSGWIEFFYNGEYLDYVSDSAQRTVDYGYTDGYLTDITNVDGNTWH